MKDSVIKILWSEPIPILEAITSPNALIEGLYYITRLYGSKEDSLYLGQSSKSIKNRLISHLYWTSQYRGEILVRIGKIIYPRRYDARLIDHAESAIIYGHRNIFLENTCKTKTYSYYDLYRVENLGNIHHLSPIVRMHDQE